MNNVCYLLFVVLALVHVPAWAAPKACLTGHSFGPSKNVKTASKKLLDFLKNGVQGASPPVSKAVPVNAGADVKCFAIITPNWPNCYVSECLRI